MKNGIEADVRFLFLIPKQFSWRGRERQHSTRETEMGSSSGIDRGEREGGSARHTVVRSPGPRPSRRNLRNKTQTSRSLIKEKEKENEKKCDTDLEFGIEVDSWSHRAID